jgi:hypothetical protein
MFVFLTALLLSLNTFAESGAAPATSAAKASLQTSEKDKGESKKPDYGPVHVEQYVDKDGNVRTRAFRYGHQFGKKSKRKKPSGSVQTETYVDKDGSVKTRAYRYGHQYGENPLKDYVKKLPVDKQLKGLKFSEGIKNSFNPGSPSSSGNSSSASPGGGTSPSDDSAQDKAQLRTQIQDLIKGYNKQKK